MGDDGRERGPIRVRIERDFERWAHFVARHRCWVIAAMLIATAALGTGLPNVTLDTSLESFFKKDDPTRVAYDEFRAQFGREDLILVAVETPDLWRLEFLERLRALHFALEDEVPHLEEVTSLLNARVTRGEGDELVVGELLEDWPTSREEVERIREIALATPLYADTLVSSDGRVTSVALRLNAYSDLAAGYDAIAGFEEPDASDLDPPYLTGEEEAEAYLAVRRVMDRVEGPGFRLYCAGGPVVTARIMFDMTRNMRVFMLLAIASIALLLSVLFRRVAGVALPLCVVLLSVVATFGLQGLRGSPLVVTTQILPSFLMAVGVGAAVHILVIFYQRYDRGASAEEAVAQALGHSGLPVAMTGLTTAGGLVSFAAAEVAPVADLGVLAPVGVLAGLLYCLILLPALLVSVPLKRLPAVQGSAGVGRVGALIVAMGGYSARHPWPVIAATAILIVVSLVGATRTRFEHDTLVWFPEKDSVRVNTAWVDERLSGSMQLEVVIDTGVENGLHDPAVLQGLSELSDRVRSMEGRAGLHVRKTLSLADVAKEIHQALNENDPAFHRVPDERRLIAQELLLFENAGSDDLEDFVGSRFSLGRFNMQLPYVPPSQYSDFIPRIEATFQDVLGESVHIETTGFMSLLAASIDAISRSVFRSYAVALLIITPLMMLLIGSLRGGLASMVPNLGPIILVLGFVGWWGLHFDLFTLLIGSIAIGLAVDDTIHFMHNFYRYFRRSGDAHRAVRQTLETTGQAMLVTSVVLCCGFFSYMLAELNNLFYFGLLTGLAIALAFIADVIVSPALVALATRGRSPG